MRRTSATAILTSVVLVFGGWPAARGAWAQCTPTSEKNVILLVADDFGWEALAHFSPPIRWHNPASPTKSTAYAKVRKDWNKLAARMLAGPAVVDSPGACVVKSTTTNATWPDALASRWVTPPGPDPSPLPYPIVPLDVAEGAVSTTFYEKRVCAPATHPSEEVLEGFGGLNALRATGVAVPRFYTTAAVCGPSRFAMMTGRQGQRRGYGDPTVHMVGGQEVTIAEYLRRGCASGPGKCYQTALFGKWHLGEITSGGQRANSPWENGFVYGAVYKSTLFGATVAQDDSSLVCHGEGVELGPLPLGATVPGRGQRGKCDNDRRYIPNVIDGQCESEGTRCDNSTRLLTELGMRFMDVTAPSPFLLVIQYPAVHNGAVGAPVSTRQHYSTFGTTNGAYYGAIEELDAAVGRILARLENTGPSGTTDVSCNTLVFFTSDNGAVGGDYGTPDLNGGKFSSYEGGVRVGLTATIGGTAATIPVGAIMSAVDLFPTIAEAAGDPVVGGQVQVGSTAHQIDGKSFYGLLSGAPGTLPRDFAYSRQTRSVVMARQVAIDASGSWPPAPSPSMGSGKGVCAYVDPLTYVTSSVNPLVQVHGASCRACTQDSDCTTAAAAATCAVVTKAERAGACDKTSCPCNRCVPAQWKVRTKGKTAMPATPQKGAEELYDLTSNPVENRDRDCSLSRPEVWYDMKCRLVRWHKCLDKDSTGSEASCENDPMTNGPYAGSCPAP